MSRQGFVYFIGTEKWALRCVKIGFTTSSPRSRLSALQTGCPYKLEVFAHIPGDIELERLLHETFAPLHMHGEWFRLDGRLIWLVAEMYSANGHGQQSTDYIDFCTMLCGDFLEDGSPHPVFGDDETWLNSSKDAGLNDRMHDEAWAEYQAGLVR